MITITAMIMMTIVSQAAPFRKAEAAAVASTGASADRLARDSNDAKAASLLFLHWSRGWWRFFDTSVGVRP